MHDINHNLKDHFLIAMPGMVDPYFAQTVTYLCEHDEKGAMGLIVNHPLNLGMADVFNELDIEPDSTIDNELPIYCGGPVQRELGFVLHRQDGQAWNSTHQVTEDIALTTSRDILCDIAKNERAKG